MTVRRTWILLALLVLVLTPAVAVGYPRLEAARSPQLQTYVVSRGRAARTVPAYGSIQAEEVIDLSFQASGQVVEVLVEDGDRVQAGDALIRLDSRAQYASYAQANLNYELAVRQLEDLQTPDDDAIRQAQANLQAAQSAYTGVATAVSDADIAAAALRYQQAQEALTAAEEARRYANPGRQSEETIALMDAQIGEASFNAEIARLQLEELRTANRGELGAAGAQIAQARAELERAQAGPSDYDIEQAQNTIDQAQIALDQARLSYERTLLTAPLAGIAANLKVGVGQRIGAGTTVLQLVDVTPISFKGEVDENDIQQIDVGMPAQVELDALPGLLFEGTLSWLAPQGRDESGIVVYDVEIQLGTDDVRVRPGMSADAAVITDEAGDTLLVPSQFVRTDPDSGRTFVDVLLADGELEARAVTLGIRGDSSVEIVSGLREGEVIALTDV
ncbi:MAG: efflux RND transporter periplasmic adaptor subunit [Anaerolineae bacterium]|nr:efflux RND transporter periplasmic adaptor subunit [Anaerolineae bacterium]